MIDLCSFLDCEQGTKPWFDARLGCPTSCRIAKIVTKRQRGEGDLKGRTDLKWELVAELLTKKPAEHFVTEWMEKGREREPLAREEYAQMFGRRVETVGFAYHPGIKLAGCSPDAIVDRIGLLEIKAPKIETHLQYIADDVVPKAYVPQCLWQLACIPDAEWIDFVSYHPDPSQEYQLFVKRIARGSELEGFGNVDALIRGYEAEVEQFNKEVQDLLSQLKERVAVYA